jgi:predicted MFS family arabinose efflux permease
MYYLATGLGVLVGSALFGVLYTRFSPQAAFHTGAALAMMAVVAVIATRPVPSPRSAGRGLG